MSAALGVTFACANMAAEACTRILYLAKRVLSSAISTSMILPFAASRVVLVRLACSRAKLKRDEVPPFSALNVATFSIACVKKLVVIAPRVDAEALVETAKVIAPEVPKALLVPTVVESNVIALSKRPLLMLTIGPDEPLAVV